MKLSYASITVVALALAWDLCAVCLRAVELPQHPISALLWATFSWLLCLWMLFCLERCRSHLRLQRALAAGPPHVWACRASGEPVELSVPMPMGLDPWGSPAWMVVGATLAAGDGVMIHGLRRYGALYLVVDDGVARLERRR